MQTRGDFLATAGLLTALSPGTAPAATPAASPAGDALPPGFTMNGFVAAVATRAAYKHLVACITDAEDALGAVRSTLIAYGQVGVLPAEVQPQITLYHGKAVLCAFDDEVWNRYVLPTNSGPPFKEKSKSGNPLLKRQGGERDSSMPALVDAANVHFFACNLAAHGWAKSFAKKLHLSESDVYDEMVARLVPNAMLVPAGVWAIQNIVARGYTLLQYA
ncbi:MAG TPA: hypothetical protein VGX91_03310 [Candidatus Cybelea sp.]|jgi:hypothetical protein|nr:hypothetical protein [Candidatus Cybelea sp.]